MRAGAICLVVLVVGAVDLGIGPAQATVIHPPHVELVLETPPRPAAWVRAEVRVLEGGSAGNVTDVQFVLPPGFEATPDGPMTTNPSNSIGRQNWSLWIPHEGFWILSLTVNNGSWRAFPDFWLVSFDERAELGLDPAALLAPATGPLSLQAQVMPSEEIYISMSAASAYRWMANGTLHHVLVHHGDESGVRLSGALSHGRGTKIVNHSLFPATVEQRDGTWTLEATFSAPFISGRGTAIQRWGGYFECRSVAIWQDSEGRPVVDPIRPCDSLDPGLPRFDFENIMHSGPWDSGNYSDKYEDNMAVWPELSPAVAGTEPTLKSWPDPISRTPNASAVAVLGLLGLGALEWRRRR